MPRFQSRERSAAPVVTLGSRVRALRLEAGLTQSQLAGDRFSKEYVSQIERGKTRPTAETIGWLASRLSVDVAFLTGGMSAPEQDRLEALVVRAEASNGDHRYRDTLEALAGVRADLDGVQAHGLYLRLLVAESIARLELGEVSESLDVLGEARQLAERPEFSDVERSEVLFRTGVARYRLSSIATAVALFDEALALADRAGLPCDALRSEILGYRSRCRRRQGDYLAAREDVERALELAGAVGDRRSLANSLFQASLVAERTGHWILARTYAQRAKVLYQELDDERSVGRLELNLGGLHLLLGNPEQAVDHLRTSFRLAVEAESQPDAAQAVGGLAAVHLELEDWDSAETYARKALELLDGREDYPHEVGPSLLVLGRSLMERHRLDEAEECFLKADAVFEQMASAGHRAGAWVALGDLASRRGNDREAARFYRNAATALQDFRF